MGEPAWESQRGLFLLAASRGPAPGLEEESSFFCSAVHSEVLKGFVSILKSSETHLELIFKVLARGQHKVIELLRHCGGIPWTTWLC